MRYEQHGKEHSRSVHGFCCPSLSGSATWKADAALHTFGRISSPDAISAFFRCSPDSVYRESSIHPESFQLLLMVRSDLVVLYEQVFLLLLF